MLINPIIVGIVLKSLKSRIGVPGTIRTMFIKIALLGTFFEMACALRIVLVMNQYQWKQYDPWKYNVVFIFYILLGEVACQIVLITGIIVYTHKLRVKYLRSSNSKSSSHSENLVTSTRSSRHNVDDSSNLILNQ